MADLVDQSNMHSNEYHIVATLIGNNISDVIGIEGCQGRFNKDTATPRIMSNSFGCLWQRHYKVHGFRAVWTGVGRMAVYCHTQRDARFWYYLADWVCFQAKSQFFPSPLCMQKNAYNLAQLRVSDMVSWLLSRIARIATIATIAGIARIASIIDITVVTNAVLRR